MFTPITSTIKCEAKMFVASFFFDRDIQIRINDFSGSINIFNCNVNGGNISE